MSNNVQNTINLIGIVEKLSDMVADGIVIDQDTILVDHIEKCDYHYSGIASDIFNIYLQSQDKKAVEQVFFEICENPV